MPHTEQAAAQPPRVLLIDDSAEDRLTFRRYLTKDSPDAFIISEAHNLAEGRRRAAADNPDCILLDYNLPDGDGVSLLQQLLGTHGRHAFGVVMLTASGETQIAVDALKSGAHDYIDKSGLTPLRLRQTVANAIAQARLHRQIHRQNLLLAERNDALARELATSRHEVSERNRAQKALAESESFLRSIITAHTDCVKVLDLEGRLLWINEPGKRVLEIDDRSPLPDSPWPSFWRDSAHEAEAHHAVAEARAGRVAQFSGLCRSKSGIPKWWDVTVAPILDSNQQPAKLLCVSRDVTASREATRKVEEKEAQLRLVSDHVAVNIAHFDRDLRIRFANRFLTDRFGKSPEELQGVPVYDLIDPDYFARARPMMEKALAGERVAFEIQMPEHQGGRWLHATYVPEFDRKGHVVGFVAVSADITERRLAQLELERARDEAVKAARARDDFLAALSHELRTPLNPVLLLASESAEDASLPPEIREQFATIRNNVELEARLIDDLLDLSRVAHGKLLLELHDVVLQDVVRDAIATVEADVTGKQLQLSVSLPAAPIHVRADPVRLQQVFWNVLKNAVKFTPESGRIWVTASTSGQRVSIAVRDSGLGITAEDLPKIFDAFAQGEHAKAGSTLRFGGLGLGLAITQRLVEMHHGRIHAASEGHQRGATFTVELPIRTPSGSTGRNDNSPTASARSARVTGTRGRRILIVEDHAATRQSLGVLLKRRGHDVALAGSAADAREAVNGGEFSLVISDIGLPDSDGYSLLRELRLQQPHLRGIALSGYGAEDDRVRSSAAGFDSHIVKPVTMSALDAAVAKVLQLDVETTAP